MINRDKDLLKEAEELESQSKFAIRAKNYGLAIQVLMKAKENYEKIGLTGQVSVVIKEIVRLKNIAQEEGVSLTIHGEKTSLPPEQSQFKTSLNKITESKTEDTSISEGNCT